MTSDIQAKASQGWAGPKRVGILTSGGDAPGMNAAIRAAVLLLASKGVEVFGVSQGYSGLIEGKFEALKPEDVRHIIRSGGTLLGSARCEAFRHPEGREQARSRLREAGIGGLIVIGGNGSLTGAAALGDPEQSGEHAPPLVIGIPASIDNDIGCTSLAIGVDTAMNTIVEACDKISDTARAHDRTFIVEVMGRDCGYLAMTAAIASAADAVLFPEANSSEEDMVDRVTQAILRSASRKEKAHRVIIIKAEGAAIPVNVLKDRVDARIDGLAKEGKATPVETRVTVLGHIVRGGRPSAFDRLLGSRLAFTAVEGLGRGLSRRMAAWTPPGDLLPPVALKSLGDPTCALIELGTVLEETRTLISGESRVTQRRVSIFDRVEEALAY